MQKSIRIVASAATTALVIFLLATAAAQASTANRPPVITSIPPVFVPFGSEYGYTINATDPDNEPLSYTLLEGPTGMWVSPAGHLRWTPMDIYPAAYSVSLAVTDPAGNTATQSFNITVAEGYYWLLDFDYFDLTSSQIMDDEYLWSGVRISATNLADGADNAVIFDTDNPTGGTLGLNSPFWEGPSNDSGEGIRFPWQVLVLSDRNDCDTATDTCPNPGSETGQPAGWIDFEFAQPAEIHAFDVYGIENSDPANRRVEFRNMDGQILSSATLPVTGPNKWDKLTPEISGVGSMRIHFSGPGAIDNLEYHLLQNPVPDTEAPHIDITFPVDGWLTNLAEITATGSLSEPAQLQINSIATTVNTDLSFNKAIDLAEGGNLLTFTAVDSAGNTGSKQLTVIRDSVPPADISSNYLVIEPATDGKSRVTGLPGSAEPGTTIRITNLATGDSINVAVAEDGSFVAEISASSGDQLEIIALDEANNASTPHTTTAPGLPADPVSIAPALSNTSITPFHEQVNFLFEGPNRIQFGVAADTIEARRTVVMRGKVLQRDGSPLAGAKVTINNHPELGYTWTRADGGYDLAVNGGGYLTVNIEKVGYLPSQRTEKTPWRDYVVLDDIALVALDANVTQINLATLSEIAVAQGSVVMDADGTRQATILVPPGTSATMTLPDGSQQPLSEIHVRATEYTVGDNGPDAMPGDLPPTSAYTYAVELSVDEAIAADATRVDFSQPLPFYVDNFLGFSVGESVPLGWYDRASATWVPSEDGIIIEILGTDANGQALIDSDGDGFADGPDRLLDLAINSSELSKLAETYDTGDSIWRVLIDHFTPWDCNWPWDLPEDATNPPEASPAQDNPDPKEPETCVGSSVSCESRIFSEDIPLTGIESRLHYQSNKTEGYKYTINVPATEENVPESLRYVLVQVEIAGRIFVYPLPALPNQTVNVIWDGKDRYGRLVNGSVQAKVEVKYMYPLRYSAGGLGGRSFGGKGGVNIIGLRSNPALGATVVRSYEVTVATDRSPRSSLAAGWNLSSVHQLDLESSTVYKGDGGKLDASTLGSLDLVVGNAVPFNDPRYRSRSLFDIEANAIGELLMAGVGGVSAINNEGVERWVVGNGNHGAPGLNDGALATSVPIGLVSGISLGPDESVYFLEMQCYWCNGRYVRRVNREGVLETLAYIESSGFDLSVAKDGSVYVTSYYGQPAPIVRIAPDGSVEYLNDIGTSTTDGIDIDDEGNLYVSPVSGNKVHVVKPDGENANWSIPSKPRSLDWDKNGNTYILTTPPGPSITGGIYRRSQNGSLVKISGSSYEPLPQIGALLRKSYMPASRIVYSDEFGGLIMVQGINVWVVKDLHFLAVNAGFEFAIPDPDDNEIHYFAENGNHMRSVDLVTHKTLREFEYDANNRLIKMRDRFGNESVVEYSGGKASAIISPNGQRNELTINADNELEEVHQPDGSSYRFTYDNQLLTSKITPSGHRFEYHYDATGRITSTTDPLAASYQFDIEQVPKVGLKSITTSPEGRIRTSLRTVSASNEPTWLKTAPDGSQSSLSAAYDGQWKASVAANGTAVRETRDYDTDLTTSYIDSTLVTTPSGLTQSTFLNPETFDYDQDGSWDLRRETLTLNGKSSVTEDNLATGEITYTTPALRQKLTTYDKATLLPHTTRFGNLAESAYTYTPEGKVQTVTTGTGMDARTTTFTYYTSAPSKGWLETVTDAESRTVSYEYDLVGRVTKQILPDLREIGYGYDANGNLTSITPPGRPAHEFTFTPVDLEDNYTPPDVLPGVDSTDYAYNLDKQLELITLPDGQTIDYVYGAATGKLDEIVIPSGSYSFSYKADSGQLETAAAPGGEQITYTYDGFLTTSVTASGTINGTVAYVYNNDFRTQALSVNGNAISFSYDDDGLLTNAGTLTLVRDSADGLLDTTSLGVVTTDNDMNTFGELEDVTAAVNSTDVYAVNYERDKLGRITEKTETIHSVATVTAYTYDLAGRLDTVTQDGTPIADYDYDSNGNRIAVNGITVGMYDDQDRLLSYDGCTYQYTANGELDTRTCGADVLDTDYDVLGNLRSTTLPDGTQIEYVIDGQNRRVGKKVNGSLVQGFLYHDQLNPVAELDATGNVTARFVYGEKANVPSYMLKNGNTYRIISDHLGSPRLVIDTATGTIVQRMDYDEWGNVTLDTDPGFQPFGFAGGIYDRETGLVRFGARDYDPQTGRWTAKDPIGFAGGLNHYAYVGNDPINWIDSNGNAPSWVAPTAAVLGTTGAAVMVAGAAHGNPAAIVAGAIIAATGAALAIWDAASTPSDQIDKFQESKDFNEIQENMEKINELLEQQSNPEKDTEPKACL